MSTQPHSAEPEQPPSRYWAFISYSSKDRAFASWLHSALESYLLPTKLINHPTPTGENAPRRLRPLFWDRAEMTAHHDLTELIYDSLRSSRYLIVVCSPHAASSPWVEKEIQAFRQMHGHERILAIIADGSPGGPGGRNCFPAAFADLQPKAPDARPQGDGRTNAKLMLIAAMLGIEFDQLKQRHLQRLRVKLLQAAAAMLVLALAAGWWWQTEQEKKQEIIRNNTAAQMVEAGRQSLLAQDPGAALAWFVAAIENGGAGETTRYLMARAIDALDAPHYTVASQPEDRIASVMFVGSSEYLLTSNTKGETTLRRAGDGALVSKLELSSSPVPTLLSVRPVARFALSYKGAEVQCLRLLDAQVVSVLEGHTAPVLTAVSSASERIAITGSADKTAKVWRLEDGQLLSSTPVQSAAITSILVSPNEGWFATGSADGKVQVWKVHDGTHIRELDILDSGITTLRTSPDGRALAAETMNGAASAWASADWTPIGKHHAASGRVRQVFFGHPEAPVAAVVIHDRSHVIKIVNLMDGKTVKELTGHTADIGKVCLADTGEVMASQAVDGTVRVWDVVSGSALHIFELSAGFSPVEALGIRMDLSPDGSRVVRVNAQGEMTVWQTTQPVAMPGQTRDSGARQVVSDAFGENLLGWNETQAWLWKTDPPQLLHTWKPPQGHAIANATLNKEGSSAVLFLADDTMLAWDVVTGVTSTPKSSAWGFDFDTDGQQCIIGVGDRELAVLDLAKWQEIQRIPLPDVPASAPSPGLSRKVLRLHPVGDMLAISTGGADIQFVSFPSGKLIHHFQTKSEEGVQDLSWSPDGSRLLVSLPKVVEVWTLEHVYERTSSMTHDFTMMSATFDSVGRRFATAGADGLVHIYDASSGQLQLTLEAGSTFVNQISFSMNKELFMTSSNEAGVRLWSMATGRLLETLPGMLGRFSPSGDHILLSGESAMLKTLRHEERTTHELEKVAARLSPWRVQEGRLVPARATARPPAGQTPPQKN